jgi:hypothetical protein
VTSIRLLLATLAGWLDDRQTKAYLREENRILRAQFRGRRRQLSGAARRRLAVRRPILGRRGLGQVATIVTRETIVPARKSICPPSPHIQTGEKN